MEVKELPIVGMVDALVKAARHVGYWEGRTENCETAQVHMLMIGKVESMEAERRKRLAVMVEIDMLTKEAGNQTARDLFGQARREG